MKKEAVAKFDSLFFWFGLEGIHLDHEIGFLPSIVDRLVDLLV